MVEGCNRASWLGGLERFRIFGSRIPLGYGVSINGGNYMLFFLSYFLSSPGNGEKLPLLIDTECAIDMTSDIRTLLHHCSPP